jgi:hypothetical protein
MPVGYHSASDVLTEDLISEVFGALGTSQKVTFGPSGSTLNKSERRLPEKLVHRIRSYLDKKNILTRRIVWFDRPKSHMGDKTTAIKLCAAGWSKQVVAAVMGYDPITLTRWGIESSDLEAPPIKMDPAVAESLGRSRLAAVAPSSLEKASAVRLRQIGQCLTELLEIIAESGNGRKEK